MDFIEKFKQKRAAAEETEKDRQHEEAGIERVKPPKGPALNQLLANSKEQNLFGLYLKNGDETNQRLGEKLLGGGELDENDFDALSERRNEFLEMRERAKNLKELIGKNIGRIVDGSSELKKITESVDIEKIRGLLTGRLDEMVISDPDRFIDLENQFSTLSKVDEAIKEDNKAIAQNCKTYGFTQDEYMEALLKREDEGKGDGGDPFAFEDLIAGKMSRMKKLFGGKKYIARRAEELEEDRSEINARLAELNASFTELGGSLRTTLFENEIARKALTANLQNETPEKPEATLSFSEIRELKKTPANKKEIDLLWKSYQKKHENDEGYTIESAQETFAEEYASDVMRKKKGGFWAMIFKSLLAGGVKDMLK